MPDLPPLTASLYATLEHDEIAAGPYLHDVAGAPLPLDRFADGFGGVDLRWRMVGAKAEEGDERVWGKESALRLWRDGDGAVRLDRLDVGFVPFMGFRSRPEMGEGFDWTIGSGRREVTWGHGNEPRAQWRVYSPITVSPIGFSNTDQDDDSALTYQMSLLGGIGGEAVARVVGPMGVQVRLEGAGRTARRFSDDTPDNVRHEVDGLAELGVTWFADRQAWTVGAWGEHLTQWNPHDGGPDGLDKQYVAGGVRLAARFYAAEAAEELLPMDLEALFGGIDPSAPPPPPPAPPVDAPVAEETTTEPPAEPTAPEPPAPEPSPADENREKSTPIARPPIGPVP